MLPKPGEVSEVMVKVAAYFLGEFGHLIQEKTESLPIVQFKILNAFWSASAGSGTATRSILVTSFMKMASDSPSIHSVVRAVFDGAASSMEPDLQQRCCEYIEMMDSDSAGKISKIEGVCVCV